MQIPKSSTPRQKEGGRALVSVRATVQDETMENKKRIRKMVSGDKTLSEYLRRKKPDGEEESGHNLGNSASGWKRQD